MKLKFLRELENQDYSLKISPSGDSDMTCETSLEYIGKLPHFPQTSMGNAAKIAITKSLGVPGWYSWLSH